MGGIGLQREFCERHYAEIVQTAAAGSYPRPGRAAPLLRMLRRYFTSMFIPGMFIAKSARTPKREPEEKLWSCKVVTTLGAGRGLPWSPLALGDDLTEGHF